MTCRLYVAPELLCPGPLVLGGDEYHYLVRVRRLQAGDELTLFDGCGRVARARIGAIHRDRAVLEAEAATSCREPNRPRLTIAVALIKGPRMDFCIQKLVELGVDQIAPMVTSRSVVKLAADRAAARRQRYLAIARDAARQARCATVPDIAPIADIGAALASLAAAERKLLIWELAADRPLRSALAAPIPASIAAAVGPEGGFTAAEVDQALAHGFAPVGLGPRILRAETAAIAAAAALQFAVGDWAIDCGRGEAV